MTTLRSERIVLRPWRPADRDSLARHANNPEVARNLRDRFPSPYTLEDADQFIAFAGPKDPTMNFAIEFEGEAVGGAGLIPGTDVHRLSAEIGYWLGQTHWGKGLAAEALKLLTEHAFTALGLVRLHAGVLDGNPASARVLEKAGYTLESRMRKAVIKGGQILDQSNYVMVR